MRGKLLLSAAGLIALAGSVIGGAALWSRLEGGPSAPARTPDHAAQTMPAAPGARDADVEELKAAVAELSNRLSAAQREIETMKVRRAESDRLRRKETATAEAEDWEQHRVGANQRQQDEAIQSFLNESTADSAWSASMTAFVEEAIESRPAVGELVDVRYYECREATCQIEVRFMGSSPVELDIAELELTAALAGRLNVMVGSEIRMDESGDEIVVYYFQQAGARD